MSERVGEEEGKEAERVTGETFHHVIRHSSFSSRSFALTQLFFYSRPRLLGSASQGVLTF